MIAILLTDNIFVIFAMKRNGTPRINKQDLMPYNRCINVLRVLNLQSEIELTTF